MTFKTMPVVRGFDAVRALYEHIGDIGIIAGGYARYCMSPTHDPAPAQDVDVFATTVENYEVLRESFEGHLRRKRETTFAVTYETTDRGKFAYAPLLQLVKPLTRGRVVSVGTVDDIIGNFDFTVVRAAITSPTEGRVDDQFEEDEKAKRLRLKNIHCPISSTLRCIKYSQRGYKLQAMDTLALFLDWEGRPPEYRKEITDGLSAMIEAERTNEGALSSTQVSALYDRMGVD